MPPPLVSIVIPTRDGAGTLPELLAAVRRQEAPFAFEIVAVDSGSRDATLALLRDAGARVLEVPPESFNHGATRNAGIAEARGSIVVLLVQDAVPASSAWLASLVAPLRDDDGVAGAYARQIPRPDASGLTRMYLERWMAAGTEARDASLSGPEELAALPPLERYRRCVFDNVCSAVRRSVWERHPFPRTPIAEDVEWARTVLLAGHRLRYVPEAAVVHSHDRAARYELMRTYLVHQRLRTLFGLRLVPTPLHALLGIPVAAASHLRRLARDRALSPRHLVRALALAAAYPVGQYLGARSADTGRTYLKGPRV